MLLSLQNLVNLRGGGGNAYALSGASGSYAVTGNAGALNVGRLLSGAAAAYSLTGNAATLLLGRKLSGAAGSYSITGQAGTLALARKLSGSAGTYTLTGNAGTLIYTPGAGSVAYSLSGAAGSYLLTGNAAGMAVSRALSGSAGAYSLTGNAGTLLVGRRLAGAAGAYALTGNAGTFTYVSVGPVAYALSGDAGAYVLTGFDGTFAWSGQADFVVTPGAQWVQPAKGETAEQKRKRRIRQGIIREEVPEVPKIEIIKPDPLAVRYAEVLQATIAEAQASGAKAREYIARLNAQIDAQEFAKQQEAARIASEIEAKARQDLEDFDITYIAALMAVF
jgi:hypothetical protein